MMPVGRREAAELDGLSRRSGRKTDFSRTSAAAPRSRSRSATSRSAGWESIVPRSFERSLRGRRSVDDVEDWGARVGVGAAEVVVSWVEPLPFVGLLPLRVRFRYSAIASASRSRILDTTGDIVLLSLEGTGNGVVKGRGLVAAGDGREPLDKTEVWDTEAWSVGRAAGARDGEATGSDVEGGRENLEGEAPFTNVFSEPGLVELEVRSISFVLDSPGIGSRRSLSTPRAAA